MTHRHPIRVYYEDTDFAGIVYYANYLKFIERARTEWLRDMGINQTRLRHKQGVVFVVRQMNADFLKPAHFDDLLAVMTQHKHIAGAKINLLQTVKRAGEELFVADVMLACVDPSGKPVRLPRALQAALQTGVSFHKKP